MQPNTPPIPHPTDPPDRPPVPAELLETVARALAAALIPRPRQPEPPAAQEPDFLTAAQLAVLACAHTNRPTAAAAPVAPPPLAEMNHVTGGSLGSGPVKTSPSGPLPTVRLLAVNENSPLFTPTFEYCNTGPADDVPATYRYWLRTAAVAIPTDCGSDIPIVVGVAPPFNATGLAWLTKHVTGGLFEAEQSISQTSLLAASAT